MRTARRRAHAERIRLRHEKKPDGEWLAEKRGRCGKKLEAATRVELVNDGFANHCLTTWLRRPVGTFAGLGEKKRKQIL